jgi:hypothetical protein
MMLCVEWVCCRGWCGEWRIRDVNGYVGMVSKPTNILTMG